MITLPLGAFPRNARSIFISYVAPRISKSVITKAIQNSWGIPSGVKIEWPEEDSADHHMDEEYGAAAAGAGAEQGEDGAEQGEDGAEQDEQDGVDEQEDGGEAAAAAAGDWQYGHERVRKWGGRAYVTMDTWYRTPIAREARLALLRKEMVKLNMPNGFYFKCFILIDRHGI